MPGDTARGPSARGLASFPLQTLITLFAQAVGFASGILVTPLVFKFSGARTYGAYVLLVSIAGLLSGIASFGIGFSAKRYLPSADTADERAALFYPQFWASQIVVLTLAGLLLAFWRATVVWTELAFFQVLFVCAYLLLQGLQSQGGDYLRATHRIVAFNFAMTAQPLIYVAIVLVMFWWSGDIGLHTLLLAQLASIAIMALFSLTKIFNEAGVRFAVPSIPSLRSDIAYGAPVVLSYIVDTVLAFSDRYLIGLMLTVEDVAYYAAAYTLASLPLFLVKAITIVLLPRLSRLIDEGQSAQAVRLVEQTIRLFLFFAVPFLAGVSVIGSDVMAIYTSDSAAIAARYALPMIAAGTIFYGLFLIYTTVSYVLLQTRQILRANFVAALLNVGLNLALLYFVHDIAVAAGTTLLSYLVILYSITSRLDRVWVSMFKPVALLRLVAASAGMAFVVFCVHSWWPAPLGNLSHTVSLAGVGVVAYMVLAFLCGAVSSADLRNIHAAFSGNRDAV